MSADQPSAELRVLREPLLEIGGTEILSGLRSSLAWLQANQEEVNDLNVFPVPDGDTGSNMYLTLRSAVEDASGAADPASAHSVFSAAAHGSLMGARGNSGVILSQIFRGFAQGLEEKDRLDAKQISRAFNEARSTAYKAVMKPTEGTILTVIRDAAAASEEAAAESDDIRLVLHRTVAEAHAAVERTPQQLQILRDAGVVDAGGFGLAVILEGFARAMTEAQGQTSQPEVKRRTGEPRVKAPFPERSGTPAVRRGAASIEANEEGWGYCTEFLLAGKALDVDAVRQELSVMGESALVVGDPELIRVHIHTDNPAALIGVASQRGVLSKLKVEDMTAQHHAVLERADTAEQEAAPRKPMGIVAVAPGEGFREILTGLGVDVVIEGGQTMNPSIEDLLNGVRQVNAESVLLLPNNKNVILTAHQIDALTPDIAVEVIPTRNLPQGIAALLALQPESSAGENVTQMSAAIKDVHALEVTKAVRKSSAHGKKIAVGDIIALLDDDITEVGSDFEAVIGAVLERQSPAPELVTVYCGAEAGEADTEKMMESLQARFPGMEFELHRGGQAHYPYVLSLE